MSQDEFVGGLVDLCELTEGDPKAELEIRLGKWAIRDDDLDLFKIVRDAVVTLATANFAFGSLPAASVASLTFGIGTLFRNIKRSGITLKPEESAVLAAMKALGAPATADEIRAVLSSTEHELADVEKVLTQLGSVVTSKDIVQLVKRADGSRWVVVGV